MINPPAFLILADDAASWRIAGLPQLDRLALALNECAETLSPGEILQSVIFWHPDIPTSRRWLPRHPKLTRVRLTEAVKSVPIGARVLHTRLFCQRDGMAPFLEKTAPVCIENAPEETAGDWESLNARFQSANPAGSSVTRQLWNYIDNPAVIPWCEKNFLRRSGKSQDGIVSRFLNRPLSRMVSAFLLRYDLTPTSWTFLTFVLPVAAFFCLARGDYGGIVAGALIFQIYSVLDGCDGEMARATYQESERGGRIDDFLDMIGSMLFVIGLGLGLFRSESSIYLLEGLACAVVIGVNEWSLRRVKLENTPDSQNLTEALYPRHRRLLAGGTGIFSERFLWWILQFTKRDAAIFAFLVLALIDQSQWILHLWLAVSAATLVLSARTSAGKGRPAEPGP